MEQNNNMKDKKIEYFIFLLFHQKVSLIKKCFKVTLWYSLLLVQGTFVPPPLNLQHAQSCICDIFNSVQLWFLLPVQQSSISELRLLTLTIVSSPTNCYFFIIIPARAFRADGVNLFFCSVESVFEYQNMGFLQGCLIIIFNPPHPQQRFGILLGSQATISTSQSWCVP